MIIKKTKLQDLCYGLSNKEFRCKCHNDSCRATIISPKLIKSYQTFRRIVNTPLIINSGYRCPEYNFKVGGVAMARHQTGEAIDISLKTLENFKLTDIVDALEIAGFKWFQFYPEKNFFHADVRG